ncbi:MAG: His/Gly/Thr/Pro-type tRNA ligase C-terminal domain-containing protein, partial [Thermoplasmata archaeon]|nr:His/Gly/Thr/Pro-type tRNA ligase C-terminal domain-containing protein [Thermoplasmata archaeon]
FTVPDTCFEVVRRKEKVSGRKFVPHVIEPSYGLDRILFSVLDHSYAKRDEYVVLNLEGLVAPIKAGVFPLMARDGLDAIAAEIHGDLVAAGLPAYYDDSGSIGRRYARMDEVGTPCCITIDYETKDTGTVTVRDRDTSSQVRIKRENVARAVAGLIGGSGFESLAGL